MGKQLLGASTRAADDLIGPSGGVSRASRPCLKGVPESAVRVIAIVNDGANAFVPPARLRLAFRATLKCKKPILVSGSSVQRFEQILDGRIVRSVTEKHDQIAVGHRPDELSSPAIREICAAEFGA